MEQQVVTPLFQFRNYGQQLPDHWSTISNESAFGTDYFTRTAVAKSALKDGDFSLYVRAYWRKTPVIDGSWTPPAVERQR